MAWVSWNRKSPTEAKREAAVLGIDLNAARVRVALGRAHRSRVILLEEPHLDLPMSINLEGRDPEVGRAGLRICRKLPHLSCGGYLPFLGHAREWQGGRHRLDAQAALSLAFEKLAPVASAFESVSIALPSYLSLSQVNRLTALAAKQSWSVSGTVVNALALAAERAGKIVGDHVEELPAGKDRVIPMHRAANLSAGATILIVEVDDHALTGSVVRVEREQVHLTASQTWSKLGTKLWKDRMLDALCDRCVRVCRRDPRDSAEAEQEMYDQLDVAMDRIRVGQKVSFTVRAFHWHQDIEHQATEFESFCSGLLTRAVDSLRELLLSSGMSDHPPAAVWLTHDAGRLPGLANALHQRMSERTRVSILQPEAVAIAAANLGERRKTGEVPKTHLDTSIPVVLPWGDATRVQLPAVKARR